MGRKIKALIKYTAKKKTAVLLESTAVFTKGDYSAALGHKRIFSAEAVCPNHLSRYSNILLYHKLLLTVGQHSVLQNQSVCTDCVSRYSIFTLKEITRLRSGIKGCFQQKLSARIACRGTRLLIQWILFLHHRRGKFLYCHAQFRMMYYKMNSRRFAL